MAEHTLYGKRKLCYTEVTDFTDFQGIGRDPLYKRFDSVYSVIEKNIEPQYRDFLAHPIYSDEDQILWYVREWDNAPCQYKDLTDAERAKYDAIKEKTLVNWGNRVAIRVLKPVPAEEVAALGTKELTLQVQERMITALADLRQQVKNEKK